MLPQRHAAAWCRALALALAAGWPLPAPAQFDEPPPPAAYALQGVTLVAPDGNRTPGINLVIRGSLIDALGPGAPMPPDAKLLEGDSLFVYPGFIDAHRQADHAFPEIETDQGAVESWNPPRHVQGFQAHRRVVDALKATGASLKADRAKGVIAIAAHPSGPLMPGRGTLLLSRPGAATPAELVLRAALAPLFTFERPRGVYPSQHFGVMAFYRQLFEDARRDGLVLEAHTADPRGLAIPPWDPDRSVVREALSGSAPAFFAADGAEDIRQVLALAREYGVRPIIVGGDEAWKVAEQLRTRNVPVLVSLDFPKPNRWKPADTTAAAPAGDTVAAAAPAPQAEVLDPAVQREKDRLENLYRNAGRLVRAGVVVALTSGGGMADLREGARKAIEYGLTESQALAALTRTPAELLGVPYLGRVEAGMPANFIVTDGPVFAEQSKIRYVFVEGVLEEGAAARPKGGEAPAADVTGRWATELAFASGFQLNATLNLTQEGATFSGTMETEFGAARVQDGVVSGDQISFTVLFDIGGQRTESSYTGTVEGDRASGRASGPQGAATWTARRAPGEGGRP